MEDPFGELGVSTQGGQFTKLRPDKNIRSVGFPYDRYPSQQWQSHPGLNEVAGLEIRLQKIWPAWITKKPGCFATADSGNGHGNPTDRMFLSGLNFVN